MLKRVAFSSAAAVRGARGVHTVVFMRHGYVAPSKDTRRLGTEVVGRLGYAYEFYNVTGGAQSGWG